MSLNKSQDNNILINILTRTSNRPLGFKNCHESIIKQNYKKVKHYVSYENCDDKKYIELEGIVKIKVEKYNGEPLVHSKGYKHAPYNLYCNELMANVEEGWILFLDDDDQLLHNNVLSEIVEEINKVNDETIFIWQMRYPNGKVLPTSKHFKSENIEINNIGSPCVIFHSKYKGFAKWDEWKGSDFRFINALNKEIPNKKWIKKKFIQINNYGDFGNRNDVYVIPTNKFIFKKTFFWFFIPKYHTEVFGFKVFHKYTYKRFFKIIFSKS